MPPRRIAWTSWIRDHHSILLADIGGTNSRLCAAGRVGAAGARRHHRERHACRPRRRDRRATSTRPARGRAPRCWRWRRRSIGGDEIALTNRAWRFRRSELAQRFGFSPVCASINDFEAIAWSLSRLDGDGRASARADASRRARASRRCSAPAPASASPRWCRPTVAGSWCRAKAAMPRSARRSPDEIEIFARLFARAWRGQRGNHPLRSRPRAAHARARSRHAPSDAAGAGRGGARGRSRRPRRPRNCSCACSAASPASSR